MANLTGSMGVGITQPAKRETVVGGLEFDRNLAALSFWFLGGLFLDGWAHNHLGDELETFFTPWHGVFYSGFLVVAAYLIVSLVRNHHRGYAWSRALPAGYNLSLIGVVIFAFGGVGDMIWHELFGIEVGVEALLSPTHLMLATGIALIVSGPLRAAWHRADSDRTPGWTSQWPMVVSLTFTLSLFTFMTQFSNTFNYPYAAKGHQWRSIWLSQAVGLDSIFLSTALLMGLVLLAIRRWVLPFGSLIFILTVNAALMSTQYEEYNLWIIPFAALAGVIADVLLKQLKPSARRETAFRLFAFAMPAILYASYFLGIHVTAGIAWTIHLWMGAIVLAGAVGLLLSCLIVPPALPVQRPVDHEGPSSLV